MTDRATIIDFIRAELAPGAVPVPDLEKRARVVGLLTQNQTLSGNKAFKAVKLLLGVRSRRSGFGAAGVWSWILSGASEPAPAEKLLEPSPLEAQRPSTAVPEGTRRSPNKELRAAAIAAGRRPSALYDCATRLAHLRQQPRPTCVPRHQWNSFITACEQFFDPSASWHDQAIAFGWTAADLVACHPSRPLDYSGSGLLWRARGGCLLALHKDWAVVHLSNGERVVHKTAPRRGFVMPWDLG